jgi:hypothetical protein
MLRDSQQETPISLQLVANAELTRTTLQTTADAVCYRYYPRCEIL